MAGTRGSPPRHAAGTPGSAMTTEVRYCEVPLVLDRPTMLTANEKANSRLMRQNGSTAPKDHFPGISPAETAKWSGGRPAWYRSDICR